MEEVTPLSSRKADHIRINLEEDTRSGITSGLENYRFIHRAVPEVDLIDIDPSIMFFGKQLRNPVLISSMTGGTVEAREINRKLALAAQEKGIAMGIGSQRIAIEDPSLSKSFQVRDIAPNILLFANLGAIQLNYGFGIEECQRAVDMIEADALILHFNALQEAIQKEGQSNFAGLIDRVEDICKALTVPVIAKEVGWGFSKQDVKMLVEAGISSIDVAGAGGTSWSQVEMYRAENNIQRELAAAFKDWGIATTDAIHNVAQLFPTTPIIASGGLRNGVDIAKCVALGASLGGMASPFLKAASQSVEILFDLIELIQQEIRLCMFATGSLTIEQLRQNKITPLRVPDV